MVCLSLAHPKFKCQLVRRHTEGGPSIGCEEKRVPEFVAANTTGYYTVAIQHTRPPTR